VTADQKGQREPGVIETAKRDFCREGPTQDTIWCYIKLDGGGTQGFGGIILKRDSNRITSYAIREIGVSVQKNCDHRIQSIEVPLQP
jgi:hypothetical protein